jgi:hypothetical protein
MNDKQKQNRKQWIKVAELEQVQSPRSSEGLKTVEIKCTDAKREEKTKNHQALRFKNSLCDKTLPNEDQGNLSKDLQGEADHHIYVGNMVGSLGKQGFQL